MNDTNHDDRPFLRSAATAPDAPAGWVSESAVRWAGRDMNVVFDPRRHTVMFTLNRLSDRALEGLRDTGWVRQASDGVAEFWVRDRLAAARTTLDHVGRTPSVEVAGRSL
jgi:hypothetical protein